MSWTTPRTWAPTDVPTADGATGFNPLVRDNLLYLYDSPRCRVRRNEEEDIPSGNSTPITWQRVDYDTHGLTNVPSTVFATIPSSPDLTGDYFVIASVEWATAGSGYRELQLRRDDSETLATSRKSPEHPGIDIAHSAWRLCRLSNTHQLSVRIFQNSGGNVHIRSSPRGPLGILHWVGKQ